MENTEVSDAGIKLSLDDIDLPLELDINSAPTELEKRQASKADMAKIELDTMANTEEVKLQAESVPAVLEEKKEERPKLALKKIRKIKVTEKSSSAWLERINNVQQKRITPEMRSRIKRRAATQQRFKMHARKCKKKAQRNRANKRVMANTMNLMSRSSVSRHNDISTEAQSQMLILQSADHDEEDEIYNSNASRLERSVGYQQLEVRRAVVLADSVAEEADEAEEIGADEMERVLVQLRREPKTDEERKAKFGLYEMYLETVVQIRKQTFEFWVECKADFEKESRDDKGPAIKSIEKSLKDLDSEENMGMPDFSGRVWFVYGMCQKAAANNDAIQKVLKMIRTKLELLSHQGECPICLDEFDNVHQPQLLACCHKVCDECWEHWKALRHGQVFCPLCRNDEFVEDVMNMQMNFPM